ncbi:histidine kinase [Flavihumibacter sp. R14]|nr:histidine kinase [Flavihumibacter soli]
MTVNEFIFSNKPAHRITRHLSFWIVYSIYFWLQSIVVLDAKDIPQPEPYKNAFINLYSFLPSCMLSVYVFIYIFRPFLLEKKKYFLFTACFILLYAFELYINSLFALIFLHNVTYNHVTALTYMDARGLSTTNTLWAYTIGVLALGIKLSKDRYLQQKENLQLLRKKADTELNFQKARFHPGFLSGSLGNIYHQITNNPGHAPGLVLKLSDILSYTLYEGNAERVPLQKEVTILEDFIALNVSDPDSSVDIQLQTCGSLKGKYVVPMHTVKIVQDAVTRLRQVRSGYYQIRINIEAQLNTIHIRLIAPATDDNRTRPAKGTEVLQEIYDKLRTNFSGNEIIFQPVEGNGIMELAVTMPLFNEESRSVRLSEVNDTNPTYELK